METMTNRVSSDTNQDHAGEEGSTHGEASEQGRTGEGSASALAHMLSQDQKHRKQKGSDSEELTSGR